MARGLTTLVSQYHLSFDEKFRNLFQSYGIMGRDMIRVAYVSVNIATRRDPEDTPIDQAAAQFKSFFRMAADHTHLPGFDDGALIVCHGDFETWRV